MIDDVAPACVICREVHSKTEYSVDYQVGHLRFTLDKQNSKGRSE
jgi:hypothetical protein